MKFRTRINNTGKWLAERSTWIPFYWKSIYQDGGYYDSYDATYWSEADAIRAIEGYCDNRAVEIAEARSIKQKQSEHGTKQYTCADFQSRDT